MSEGGGQKVVVTQTCMDLRWNDMKWIVDALQLPLNPGDDVILLGLPHLIDPSTASFLSSRNSPSLLFSSYIFSTYNIILFQGDLRAKRMQIKYLQQVKK